LGPQRYPEIARRYQPLVTRPERLAVDINVVERYQDVYPTRQQTGVELFELLHMASIAFSRVAVYFENSISPMDMKLLPAATADVRSVQRVDGGIVVDSPRGVGLRWEGPALVDGAAWPFHTRDTVWLPAGKHTVTAGTSDPPLQVLGLSATLLNACSTASTVEFEYDGDSRAAVLVAGNFGRALVDGKSPEVITAGDHITLLLPRGRHKVELQRGGERP
jgi:hypothetical protein